MSEVKFSRVISCTSEEPGYLSSNLLNPSVSSGKWRCKPGEKTASVVIQLERSVKIGQIDIGNNGSAFIEVLVGKASASSSDFSVILPSSSFMSPVECKVSSSGNACRVRMFNLDKLVKNTSEESWDMIKVVCTQPFNKTVPFGVSFIKVYTVSDTPSASDGAVVAPIQTETRTTSKEVMSSPKKIASERSSREVTISEFRRPSKRQSPPEETKIPKEKRIRTTDETSSRPLQGVVFVLSGFQNPERGSLRNKAIELGAKYEADWNSRCTHLVCAFANTPKYNQVKGKGKIVTKKWIEDCYKQKDNVHWQNYELHGHGKYNSHDNNTATKRKASPDNENNNTKLTSYLPDLFTSKSFYIHDSVDSEMKSKLDCLIVAYGGDILQKISSAVDFMIAKDGTDVEQYEIDHPELVIVRPDWILACQKKQKFLPHDQFTLS